jgi:hypothetical protein
MGGTTSPSFLDLHRQPKICSVEEWAVQMGNHSSKLSLSHGTRAMFGLPKEAKEIQHRFASLMGFPFFDNVAPQNEEDNDLIDSDTEDES